MNKEKLKNARALKGLIQTEIAKKIGMSAKAYNQKEVGVRKFAVLEIIQVARVLDLTLEDVHEIFFDNKLTKCLIDVN